MDAGPDGGRGGDRAKMAQVGGERGDAAAALARQRAELLQAAHGPDTGVRMRQHAGEHLRAAGVDPGQQVPCGRQVQFARTGQGGRGGRLINAAQQRAAHAALGFIQMRDGTRRAESGRQRAEVSHRNGQGGAGRRAFRGRPAGPACGRD